MPREFWDVSKQTRVVSVSGILDVFWPDTPTGQKWRDDFRKKLIHSGLRITREYKAEETEDVQVL